MVRANQTWKLWQRCGRDVFSERKGPNNLKKPISLCVNLYDFTSNDDDFELLRKGYKPAITMVNNFQEWQKSELHTIR